MTNDNYQNLPIRVREIITEVMKLYGKSDFEIANYINTLENSKEDEVVLYDKDKKLIVEQLEFE